ncbi:MAG: biopolymer transporter ExbD [bacterium]
MATKKTLREAFDAGELNLLPIMNLICLLIPFLLMAAQFIKVGVIMIETPRTSRVPGKVKPGESLNLALVITDQGFYLKSKNGAECPPGVAQSDKLCFRRQEGRLTDKVLKSLQHHLWKLYASKYKHHPFSQAGERHAITVIPEPNVSYDDLVRTFDVIREVPKDATNPPLSAVIPAGGCAMVYDRKGSRWGYQESGGTSVQDTACMYHRITLALGSS